MPASRSRSTATTSLDDRQLDLLAGIAAQAKLALTNALSFESLERTFLSTVEALANALEAKDEYTSSHARWIRDMSVRVGEELGLDAVALKRVELGALFHDIGKIGIPSAILVQARTADRRGAGADRDPPRARRADPGTDRSARVRPADRPRLPRALRRRWATRTGSRASEIPLEARIIFVCDAFHAMTTTRPYRDALPVDEARRRLLEAAGSQFDPAIVEVCLRVLEAPVDP